MMHLAWINPKNITATLTPNGYVSVRVNEGDHSWALSPDEALSIVNAILPLLDDLALDGIATLLLAIEGERHHGGAFPVPTEEA